MLLFYCLCNFTFFCLTIPLCFLPYLFLICHLSSIIARILFVTCFSVCVVYCIMQYVCDPYWDNCKLLHLIFIAFKSVYLERILSFSLSFYKYQSFQDLLRTLFPNSKILLTQDSLHPLYFTSWAFSGILLSTILSTLKVLFA